MCRLLASEWLHREGEVFINYYRRHAMINQAVAAAQTQVFTEHFTFRNFIIFRNIDGIGLLSTYKLINVFVLYVYSLCSVHHSY